MKHSKTILLAAFIGLALSFPAFGQEASEKAATPGFVQDYLGQLDFIQNRLSSLEQAMAPKASWRPAEKVRSTSEVFLHVAFGNYIITKMMGFEPPAEAKFTMDIEKWDTQTTDMGKIDAIMKASFDHVREVAKKMSAADLEKKMNLFGMEMTWRNGLISTLDHMHEHLGQSIAYARMNGIVPPWTSKEEAAEKANKEKAGG